MTTSFALFFDQAEAQFIFSRVQTTYDLAHRGRVAPPPFNIVVVVIWSAIRIINMMISGCTCGRCKLSLNAINPYYIGFLNRGSQHSDRSIVLRNNGILKSKDYSASQEKKEDRE
eukprot:428761_1